VKTVNPGSLSSTLDAVNEAFFYGRPWPKPERERVARWIAGRQGMPGSYRGFMFAPTENDFKEGVVLFSGERLRTRAGLAHILGEEACRALILLGAATASARRALEAAAAGMTAALNKAAESERWHSRPGEYCCGRCTVALWRHLAAGGLKDARAERWLAAGMRTLRSHRDGKGQWRRFPFYYTLLALSDISLASAVEEMRYAAPACERYLKKPSTHDPFDQRRRLLAERILEKC